MGRDNAIPSKKVVTKNERELSEETATFNLTHVAFKKKARHRS